MEGLRWPVKWVLNKRIFLFRWPRGSEHYRREKANTRRQACKRSPCVQGAVWNLERQILGEKDLVFGCGSEEPVACPLEAHWGPVVPEPWERKSLLIGEFCPGSSPWQESTERQLAHWYSHCARRNHLGESFKPTEVWVPPPEILVWWEVQTLGVLRSSPHDSEV